MSFRDRYNNYDSAEDVRYEERIEEDAKHDVEDALDDNNLREPQNAKGARR